MKRRLLKKCSALLAVTAAVGLLCAAVSAASGTGSAAGVTPIARNLQYSTFSGVAITGQLTAVDPDGEMLEYAVVSQPKKGSVELGENGSFTYTPKEGKRGRDSFTYTATDATGNVSQPAEVTVTLRRQTVKLTYADMQGHPACYAALCLAQEGVFVGQQLGGDYFFRPEAEVTRGEFLAMCMQLCSADVPEGITRTGFYDDEQIPLWTKPYVATALLCGIVEGYADSRGLPVFDSESPVTFAEAAVMLNNCLDISDATYLTLAAGEECPAWAYQATVNLVSCGVIPSGSVSAYRQSLTRADAAELLLGAMQTLESRGDDRTVFG